MLSCLFKFYKKRSFTSSSVLFTGDNSSLMARIEDLLKKNNAFRDKYTPISAMGTPGRFMDKRTELNNKLDLEQKSMDQYLDYNSKNLSDDSINKWMNLTTNHAEFINKIGAKMSTLKPESPSYIFEMFKLNRVYINAQIKFQDSLETIIYESNLKEMENNKTDPSMKSIYETLRMKRLDSRKEVLESDKEFASKEKEYFENKRASSLIDDFADVSLEQPSHMDPED